MDPDRDFEFILRSESDSERPVVEGRVIGESRQGRPITGYRFGSGPLRINLVGGCHADEPVGPRFLGHLVQYLAGPAGGELRERAEWSVIPHLNPDGAQVNAAWQTPGAEAYDFISFLRHRVRELPGDDIEFGFPRFVGEGVSPVDPGAPDDPGARPENRAAQAFWHEAAPYDLHASMHGMSVAGGPYFLVERSWWPRFESVAGRLTKQVAAAGYRLHDVERNGEKGFHRLAPGYCSRPDSRPMRDHFLALGDPDMASRFRPSSMEAVRALGGDPLTLVTEMPLFLTPGVGAELGPPDPVLMAWRERVSEWLLRVQSAPDDRNVERLIRREVGESGLTAMPVADQMRFQWAFICAGIGLLSDS